MITTKTIKSIIIIIMVVMVAADMDIGRVNINIGAMITIKDNFMVAIIIRMDAIDVVHQITTTHERQM